jgi:cytochrome c553
MPFEKGNQHGAKPRLFDAALRKAIAQDNHGLVRKCAEKLLELAAEGEQWAVKELADRLDGKATQQVDMNVNDQRSDELSDSQLLSIAAAGSRRAAEKTGSTEKSSSVH